MAEMSPRDSGGPTDDELVRQARAGSPAALGELIARYQPALLRYLGRLADEPDQAADLAQETFLSALSSLDHLRDTHAVGAWLRAIALHHWQTTLRRRRCGRAVPLDCLPTERTGSALQMSDIASVIVERDAVGQALAKLKVTDRSLLRLLQAGYTNQEIAALMGVDVRTIRRRLLHAKAAFRSEYWPTPES